MESQTHSGAPPSLFGVRVQVQGVKGQPCVVVNPAPTQDVCVISHQDGYHGYPPGTVRRTPPFHYQRHPEQLRPPTPEGAHPKPRIPLPAEEPTNLPGPSSLVDSDSILSVGRLISQFNSSQPRGRSQRHRCHLGEGIRSRSVDSSSSSSSPCMRPPGSARHSLRGETTFNIRDEETKLNIRDEETKLNIRDEETTIKKRDGETTINRRDGETMIKRRDGETMIKRRDGETTIKKRDGETTINRRDGETMIKRRDGEIMKKRDGETTLKRRDEASDDRDVLVTPDLLRGRQQLSVDSCEDEIKHILMWFLKEGTTDDDSTTQRKVCVLVEKINSLKWKTAKNVEEEDVKMLRNKQGTLEKEVFELKTKLDTELKNEMTLAKACEKARTEKKKREEELIRSQTELHKLKKKMEEIESVLQSTKDEMGQMKAEKQRSKSQMNDLHHQLSEMHDELELKTHTLHQQEEELKALKAELLLEVESHDRTMCSMKEEFETLLSELEHYRESNIVLSQQKIQVEEKGGAAQVQLKELDKRIELLNHHLQESKNSERLMEQRTNQLEREKQQVEEMLKDASRKEEAMCLSNQELITRLEDVQAKLTKLNHDHGDVKEKLKEERKLKEEMWRTKAELEDKNRLQERVVEQLQMKMNSMMEESEASTDILQNQVDEVREKSQREMNDLRRQLQEKTTELEKSRHASKNLQEERFPLEEELRRCRSEHQDIEMKNQKIQQRVGELQQSYTATLDERDKQLKLYQGRVAQLEDDLSEERTGADHLIERLDKSKEQTDHMRNELMMERSTRHDLECDKMSLERQNKELKSRVTHLEGSQKVNQDSMVSKLNSRIQEMEEQLQGEERENKNIQQINRKLERKIKEIKIQSDEENVNLQTQRDQLTQRLKTCKRQMDEVEAEMERLENSKKKLQREVDEQTAINEQLHEQLRNQTRRRKKSFSFPKDVDDDVDWNQFGSE